ncbi:MAG: magnesium protoporphyrin IX methyltransferase [Gammaproteobacteria bacterium]|jgi:magnesium-protoporphyrin O-methyltransferase|nr:magnesium protoporphyrin IX methyltransferase [Gammaproteobacteria bacterium]
MVSATYHKRQSQLEHYFDRTAAEAWSKLTSDAPVSGIRATVRAGRDRMRATLLGWLPDDLTGRRVLDAGCGTGMLSVEAARRGAEVVAIDLSETLVGLARERQPTDLGVGSIDFRVGEMLDPALGTFDHVVAMDSLIHYRAPDMVRMIDHLARRLNGAAHGSVVFTIAPRTPALSVMHAVGKLFPRGDRAPAIEPIAVGKLRRLVDHDPSLAGHMLGRSERIVSGFYTSQAMELRPR